MLLARIERERFCLSQDRKMGMESVASPSILQNESEMENLTYGGHDQSMEKVALPSSEMTKAMGRWRRMFLRKVMRKHWANLGHLLRVAKENSEHPAR